MQTDMKSLHCLHYLSTIKYFIHKCDKDIYILKWTLWKSRNAYNYRQYSAAWLAIGLQQSSNSKLNSRLVNKMSENSEKHQHLSELIFLQPCQMSWCLSLLSSRGCVSYLLCSLGVFCLSQKTHTWEQYNETAGYHTDSYWTWMLHVFHTTV